MKADLLWKIIGWLLVGIGVLITFVLLTYGGPIFPHIIGPTALALVGAALLWKNKLFVKEK